jgi:hypothetical protein
VIGTLDRYAHPAYVTAVATLAGYIVALGIMFALLFLVPYLLW